MKQKLCVYCLKPFEDGDSNLCLEKEHVFPRSWYTDTQLNDTQAITVPAHHKCNQTYQQIEDELRIRLALITSPDCKELENVRARALRAINPECGKNKKDREYRANLRKQILSDVEDTVEFDPDKGFIPNYQFDISRGDRCSIVLIKAKSIKSLTEKLIRGITYYEEGLLIPLDWEIDMRFIDERSLAAKDTRKYMARFISEKKYHAPGLYIERYVTETDRRMALFKIDIWGLFIIRGWVLPKEELNSTGSSAFQRF